MHVAGTEREMSQMGKLCLVYGTAERERFSKECPLGFLCMVLAQSFPDLFLRDRCVSVFPQCYYLSTEMFYVEINIDQNGRVLEAKIHHIDPAQQRAQSGTVRDLTHNLDSTTLKV